MGVITCFLRRSNGDMSVYDFAVIQELDLSLNSISPMRYPAYMFNVVIMAGLGDGKILQK